MKPSKNYQTFVEALRGLCITDIVRAKRLLDLAIEGLNLNDLRGIHAKQDAEEVINDFDELISMLLTDKICPHCKSELYVSDLPQYDYFCEECDEDFYECEV